MAVTSGIGGAINGINTLRTWNLTHSDAGPTFVASNSDGMEGSLAGNADWSGTADVYGYAPALLPGEAISFQGWNGTSRATGTGIINSASMTCDIEGGGVIAHSLGFQSNGALSFDTTTVSDATVPAAYTSIGCKAAWDAAGGTSFTDLSHVKNWSWNIACATQQYADSGTAGIIKRVAGNLSGSMTVTVNEDGYSTLPTIGSIGTLGLYVTATLLYTFKYARVVSVNPTTDIEGSAINAATIQYAYTGFKRIAGTMTKGSIKKPDTTNYWD